MQTMMDDQAEVDTRGRTTTAITTITTRRTSTRRHRRHDHVFWSSLCGMFEGGSSSSKSSSKTDACSLAFCGIWLWERNRFILTGETPKPWYERPVEVMIIVLLVVTALIWSLDPYNVFISLSFIVIAGAILWKLFEFQYERTVFRQQLAIEEYRRRQRLRMIIQNEMDDDHVTASLYQHQVLFEGSGDNPQNDPDLMLFLGEHQTEIYGDGAHALCGCADASRNPVRSHHHYAINDDGDYDDDEDNNNDNDFCSYLWKLISNLCCGVLCSCYIQCCGICAIAQEHRHLKHRLLLTLTESTPGHRHIQYQNQHSADLWQVDYITFEPWSNYYPSIVRLRVSNITRFVPHVRAMSILSTRLLKSVCIFLMVTTSAVILLPVHFPRWQILILYGTLIQPMVILSFIHWLWHRLDLSLDAVIKYFASGFFICTNLCILYEMAVAALSSILVFLISLLGALGLGMAGTINIDGIFTTTPSEEGGGDDIDILEGGSKFQQQEQEQQQDAPKVYMITITLLAAFLNAFFVAALVEEIGKYLCFWMVEHPDLEEHDEPVFLPPMGSVVKDDMNGTGEDDDPTGGIEENDDEKTKLRLRDTNSKPTPSSERIKAPAPSLESRGSAITIAMVTTALGFACAENLLYVFVYSPPGLDQEISTLIIRCLFPIHPLAAALQSIGVVKRDIEHDRSYQVGRIIFPGWILHGSFDFALMAYSQISNILHPDNDGDTTTDTTTGNVPRSDTGQETEEELQSSAFMVSMVMLIPLIGMLCYFKMAWAQRERLEVLDRRRGVPS